MTNTITLYVASADADDGTHAAVFLTEREAEDWIIAKLDDFASRSDYDIFLAANPDNDIWEYIEMRRRDSLDTFNLVPQDITLPMPRVVVALEGGLVQGASSDLPVDMVVVDYDTEGGDDEDIVDLPQNDGSTAESFIRGEYVDIDPAWVDAVFAVERKQNGGDIEDVVAMPDVAAALATSDLPAAGYDELVGRAEQEWTGQPPAKPEPGPGDVAEGREAITNETIGYLVRDGLDLLDAVGWATANGVGAVRFLTLPDEGDEGTIWNITISREN